MPSQLFFRPFDYIGLNNKARRLGTASTENDGIETVFLRTPVMWFNGTYENAITVTSNGQICLGSCQLDGVPSCGVISVAETDLDPSLQGDVYFLDAFAGRTNGTTNSHANESEKGNSTMPKQQSRGKRKGRWLRHLPMDETESSTRWLRRARSLQYRRWVNGSALDLVYVVSWENIPSFGVTGSSISAQARFYYNGTMELCWGEAKGNG